MPLELSASPDDATLASPGRAALRRVSSLPGPRPLPLIGNAHQFKIPTIHLSMQRWAQEHGKLFRVLLGPLEVFVVADHALVTGMLKDRPHTFRRASDMTEIIEELGVNPGVFNAEGQDWLNQRRMVMASFSPGHIRAYHPAMARVSERLRSRWTESARQGRTIDLLSDLMRYTVDVISGLSFGVDINTLQGGEDVIQRHLDKVFPAWFNRIITIVPYWRVIKLPSDRDLDHSVAVINEAIAGFVAQARQRMRDNPALRQQPSNLLEAMINAADQEGSGVDDRDVAGNMFTMLLAGEDTTAASLAWLIHLLYLHPQMLQQVKDEVRTLAGPDRHISPEQLDALPLLEACIHETMRLKPVAAVNPLEALRDTVVGDVDVPAGTVIWAMMRHDSISESELPEPLKFMPARWIEGQGHDVAAAKRLSLPFGAGPRVCPGRYLAMLEIKMAMAMLLTHFEIDQVDTAYGPEAREAVKFTMSPVGLRMRLRERARDGDRA